MRKIVFFLTTALFFLLIILAVFFCSQNENNKKVCFKENCYSVEIANTQEQREKGLMFREKIEKNQGMLFINESEGIYPVWMKNMNFPLDIVWLDKDMKTVYIYKNAQPCANECQNIVPDKMAQYIVEINAGEADKNKVKTGDILIFKNNTTKYEFFTNIRK